MILVLSFVANLMLATALIVVIAHANRRVVREKLATYAGCIGAISNSFGRENKEEQIELLAAGLASTRGGMNKDSFVPLLAQASLICLSREKVSIDVLGEHARLSGYDVISLTPEANDVANYIMGFIERGDVSAQEPRERFSNETLTSAQIQIEKKMLDFYAATLNSNLLFG